MTKTTYCVLIYIDTLIFALMGVETPAADFTCDFRTRGFDDTSFQVTGNDAKRHVESNPEGLRLKLIDGKKHGPTGIELKFPLIGDFEIYSTYEITGLEPPEVGYGVGIGLYIEAQSPTKEGITLERFVVPREGEVFAVTRSTMSRTGQRQYSSKRFPARARCGKLRLSRQGSLLTASVVEGFDGEFRVLQASELGTGDVDYVRLAADTGGSDSRLDAYFKDLRITAEAFSRPTSSKSSLSRIWTRLVTCSVGVTIAVMTILYWSRRKVVSAW